jgi:endonuclease G
MKYAFFFVVVASLSGFISDDSGHDTHILYSRNDYEVLYCEKYEQAVYVKYTVNKEDVYGSFKRRNNFKQDKEIEEGSASLSDYRKSGYDRGHLKPAAVSKGSKLDMDQSFLMSNMSPQLPEFNRQGWKNIEAEVRKLLKTQDSIIVYTGAVFSGSDEYIGNNKIGVPNGFFKAVLFGDSTKAFGFLCPHKKLDKDINKYLVSIDSIEAVTGLDLFPGLDEDMEE